MIVSLIHCIAYMSLGVALAISYYAWAIGSLKELSFPKGLGCPSTSWRSVPAHSTYGRDRAGLAAAANRFA